MTNTKRTSRWTAGGQEFTVEELIQINQEQSLHIASLRDDINTLEEQQSQKQQQLKKELIRAKTEASSWEKRCQQIAVERDQALQKQVTLQDIVQETTLYMKRQGDETRELEALHLESKAALHKAQSLLREEKKRFAREREQVAIEQAAFKQSKDMQPDVQHWMWHICLDALTRSCGDSGSIALNDAWDRNINDWLEAFPSNPNTPVQEQVIWLGRLLTDAGICEEFSCKVDNEHFVCQYQTPASLPHKLQLTSPLPTILAAFLRSITSRDVRIISITAQTENQPTQCVLGARPKP